MAHMLNQNMGRLQAVDGVGVGGWRSFGRGAVGELIFKDARWFHSLRGQSFIQ